MTTPPPGRCVGGVLLSLLPPGTPPPPPASARQRKPAEQGVGVVGSMPPFREGKARAGVSHLRETGELMIDELLLQERLQGKAGMVGEERN